MTRSHETTSSNPEISIESAQADYNETFNNIVAKRTGTGDGGSIISRLGKAGYVPILSDEIHPQDVQQIELPDHLKNVVKDAFRGFPNDEKTNQPAVRVKSVSFYQNRAAIDIEPTIPTPPREGIETEFICYPDKSRTVFNSLRFFIAEAQYIIGLGNPNGQSTWVFSTSYPPRPDNGERKQLTGPIIKDLAYLMSKVQDRKHSNLEIHKIHS